MTRRPRRIGETVYTESGLRLPPLSALKRARWPWVVLVLSPVLGIGIAAFWNFVIR